jgi:hypothetical protein
MDPSVVAEKKSSSQQQQPAACDDTQTRFALSFLLLRSQSKANAHNIYKAMQQSPQQAPRTRVREEAVLLEVVGNHSNITYTRAYTDRRQAHTTAARKLHTEAIAMRGGSC